MGVVSFDDSPNKIFFKKGDKPMKIRIPANFNDHRDEG